MRNTLSLLSGNLNSIFTSRGRFFPTSLFIPSGSDSLITSDGNTFKVREA